MSDRKDTLTAVFQELGRHHTSERQRGLASEQVTVVTCMCGRFQASVLNDWRPLWDNHVAEALEGKGLLKAEQLDRNIEILDNMAKAGMIGLLERLPDWLSGKVMQGTTKAGHIDEPEERPESSKPETYDPEQDDASHRDQITGQNGGHVMLYRATREPEPRLWLNATSPQLGSANGINRVNATLLLSLADAGRLRSQLTALINELVAGER